MDLPSAALSAAVESEGGGEDQSAEGSVGGREEGKAQHDADWPRPPVAGMFANHPEIQFPAEDVPGIVSIEPPCVYFFPDPDYRSADGRRFRLALSLPYPDVRFDESTQTLWNGDIPISHGDRVGAGGGSSYDVGGKEHYDLYLFWDACAAHGVETTPGLTSIKWYCTQDPPEWPSAEQEWQRVCVEDKRPWNQGDLLEREGLAPVVEPPSADQSPGEPPPVTQMVPPPFLDMHPYHPDMELEPELSKLVGILSIEPAPPRYYLERKCVYLYPTAASTTQAVLWGDSWKHTGPDGRPLAVRLELPYPQVRFEEDTWTLWNGDIGPMTTGDRVIADPISLPDFSDNRYGDYKQPHEPQIHPCKRAGASATVLDIRTVEHYCTHDTPPRHQSQCEQAMSLRNQPQTRLTLPE